VYRAAIYSLSAGEEGQDRAAVVETGEGLALILADGAGGVSGGARAAGMVVEETQAWLAGLHCLPDPNAWSRWLVRLDERLLEDPLAGDSTAIGVSLTGSEIAGASVGDSEAWLIGVAEITVLTRHQRRKPMLGGGEAVPVPFACAAEAGCLIVGSDGLFRFAREEAIRRAAADADVDRAARELVESARLPSGELWDDATAIVCRI
jgi:serine/threonine protein phosphatase PrpC